MADFVNPAQRALLLSLFLGFAVNANLAQAQKDPTAPPGTESASVDSASGESAASSQGLKIIIRPVSGQSKASLSSKKGEEPVIYSTKETIYAPKKKPDATINGEAVNAGARLKTSGETKEEQTRFVRLTKDNEAIMQNPDGTEERLKFIDSDITITPVKNPTNKPVKKVEKRSK